MTQRKIGKFTVEEKPLGKGGMGVVYKAFDPMLKRHVAIKLMHGMIGDDPASLERFYEEARTAVRLQHRNIVAVYDMGTDGDDPYIVMEFIPGEDLKTLIDSRAFLPFRTKLQIISELCVALDHAHSNEVIHRDVKPGNVRIKDDGEVKVLDFGIAKVASLDLTASGVQVGSPNYMSPEQIKGQKLDGRSDLWSVGVILYELLTFIRPFDSEDLVAIQWKIVNESPLPLGDLLPGCCPMLTEIIDRALSKEREDRFGKGSDIVEALSRFLDQLPAETQALESDVKSHQDQLQRFCKSLEGPVSQRLADPLQFEVVQPEGTADDYGMLLHWNKAILDRLREAEQLGVSKAADRAEEQLEPGGALDKTINSTVVRTGEAGRQPPAEQALELQREHAEKLDLAESFFEQDQARCRELCEEVLDSDPEHPRATELRDRVLQLQERRRRLDELWMQAQQETGDQEARLETASRALELNPDSSRFKEIQERALADLEKKQRLEQTLTIASGHLEDQDFETSQAVAAEGLQLDPDHSGLRGILALSEERIAERDRAGRRPSRRKWVYTAVAAIAVLVIGLYFALPEEVTLWVLNRTGIVPSPTDSAPDAGTDIAQLLGEAEGDLQAKRFEQSAKKAQVILKLSPGNRRAQEILDRGNQALREIAEGVEKRRSLVQAGNLAEVGRAPTGVVERDPENREDRVLVKEKLSDSPPQPSDDTRSAMRRGRGKTSAADTSRSRRAGSGEGSSEVSEDDPKLTAGERANRVAVSKLLRRLEEAYETKDIEAFGTFWPSFPESRREALEDNFRRAISIVVDFQLIDSKFSGDTGFVTAKRRDRWIMQDREGNSEIEVRIAVRKNGKLWVIESLESVDKVSIEVEEQSGNESGNADP